jgi:Mn2+/Fe2+ NRAMP family transporter
MTVVLFAYIFASFYAHVDWGHALAVMFVPHLEWSRGFLSVLVAILRTTISPYLFFWQAAEEVEERRPKGRTLAERRGATAGELRTALGFPRGRDAVLVGGNQWPPGAASDPACHSLNH